MAGLLEFRRLGVLDLDDGATGEFHREVQAARDQEEDGRGKSQEGNDVEDQRMLHQREIPLDSEQFHDSRLS